MPQTFRKLLPKLNERNQTLLEIAKSMANSMNSQADLLDSAADTATPAGQISPTQIKQTAEKLRRTARSINDCIDRIQQGAEEPVQR